TVAIIGCGGVGLSAVNGAAIAGAGRIIAIDAVEDKLAFAQKVGATDVIDASGGGVVEKVMNLTGGLGVDYSFEAIGKKETAEQAFDMLDKGGTATIIGMIPEGTKFLIDGPSILGRHIQGSSMGSNRFRIDMPHYLEFYRQGRLKLDEIISKRIKLEDINEAFDDMRDAHLARSVIMFD
ncbi:MAG: zinc-binding dehydrogenase, partial [Chloroflexi bacterium]|nr:zinc-binding dehydrogenase [Chloroflexota bacterium]